MAERELRRYESYFFKAKSSTDNAQVPVVGATASTPTRQGATAAETVVFNEQETHSIGVQDAGLIEVGDVLFLDLNQDVQLIVLAISADRLSFTLQNIAGFIAVAAGQRLRPVANTPVLFKDPRGLIAYGATPPTVDVNGFLWFYTPTPILDFELVGGGLSSPRLYTNVRCGWLRGGETWLNSDDFSSIQAAIDALPPGGGTVYIPAGDYLTPSELVVRNPFTQILGDGDGTVIHGSILCPVGYCTFDNLRIMGTGKQFGLRLSATVGGVATSGVPRCKLSRLSIGGSFDGAGDGPFNCLELDGAIVTTARNCLFSFSTGGSGIFIDTTQSNPPPAGKWSTNVNRFIQCTCNGNTEYGLKAIGGGIQGVSFVGGNIESNHTGAVLAQAVAGGFVLREVDFENDNAHTVENLITIEASVNPFVIEDCNFVTQNTGSEWNTIGTQSVTKRVIIVAGSHQGSIKRNRFAEFNPGNSVPLIVIGVDASNCEVENNNGFDVTGGHNNLIEHRGYWT